MRYWLQSGRILLTCLRNASSLIRWSVLRLNPMTICEKRVEKALNPSSLYLSMSFMSRAGITLNNSETARLGALTTFVFPFLVTATSSSLQALFRLKGSSWNWNWFIWWNFCKPETRLLTKLERKLQFCEVSFFKPFTDENDSWYWNRFAVIMKYCFKTNLLLGVSVWRPSLW